MSTATPKAFPMTDADWSELDDLDSAKDKILDAALPDVAFDGWSPQTLRAAVETSGVDPELARLAFPRGAVDLALYFHDRADMRLRDELAETDLSEMRIREKIAFGVRRRLELVGEDREAVRRAASMFALPPYAADGASAIWRSADIIWTGIGDTSDDANWYTKRAILSSVFTATTLFWLGDSSEDCVDTWAFLDRRIEGVMQFEKVKASVNNNPLGKALLAGPNMLMKMVKAPTRA